MKKISALLGFCFLFTTYQSLAQTADEVINKYIVATGGLEKWKALKSLYMEGVAVMQNGNEVTSIIYKVQNQLFRREVNFGMGSMTMIVTDKEGWASTPRSAGKYEALPAEAVKDLQRELDIAGPLIDYAAKGHTAMLEGKDTIDGKETVKIKLSLKSGKEITYFIDSKENNLLRQTSKESGMMGGRRAQGNVESTVTINYADFRKTPEGLTFPFTIQIANMGASMNVEKIEINKPVDPKLYKPGN